MTRIDQWLWSVRQTKSRSAATAACRAGHVRINDVPAKASATVVVGDRIRFRVGGVDRFLEVTRLIEKRVGAPIAAECYIDRTPPPPPRTAMPAVVQRDRGAGRPTKKDRRELDRLMGRGIR